MKILSFNESSEAELKLKEFMDSDTELFDQADYEYYADVTGIPFENLLARKADQLLIQKKEKNDAEYELAKEFVEENLEDINSINFEDKLKELMVDFYHDNDDSDRRLDVFKKAYRDLTYNHDQLELDLQVMESKTIIKFTDFK
jgi:hypothetical protein